MDVFIEFVKIETGELVYRTEAPYSEIDALVQIADMTAAMKVRGATGYCLVDRDGDRRQSEAFDA